VRDGEVEGAELAAIEDGTPVSAGDLMAATAGATRLKTGLAGLDHVLGGGLPPFGGAILLCGDPGAGKTTLIAVTFRELALAGHDVMVISAEQGLKELAQQLSWLGRFPSKHFLMHHVKSRDDIIKAIEKNKAVAYAVDSLHAVEDVTDSEGYSLATGHANAVAQAGTDLKDVARDREALIFAVGHVNGDGTIAGGRRVQYMLDGTLSIRYAPGLSKEEEETDPRRFVQFEGKTRLAPRGRRARMMMYRDSRGFVDEGPVEFDDFGDEDDEEDED
jgi:predicted ATP-dependent serine protease